MQSHEIPLWVDILSVIIGIGITVAMAKWMRETSRQKVGSRPKVKTEVQHLGEKPQKETLVRSN
jgi:hypothetical protein